LQRHSAIQCPGDCVEFVDVQFAIVHVSLLFVSEGTIPPLDWWSEEYPARLVGL